MSSCSGWTEKRIAKLEKREYGAWFMLLSYFWNTVGALAIITGFLFMACSDGPAEQRLVAFFVLITGAAIFVIKGELQKRRASELKRLKCQNDHW